MFYYYNKEIVGFHNAQSGVDADLSLVRSFMLTARELRKLQIDTPDGTRNISYDEAISIASFIGTSAKEIVENAKKANKP